MGDCLVNWDKNLPFVEAINVDHSDIDELGHVNNAAYVRWLERCAWRHSESLGLGVAEYKTLDRAMVVLRHEIDYLAAAYLDDQVMVATWITETDNKLRLTRHFQIIRPADQMTLLRARSTFVCIELSSGKARRMPAIFVDTYGQAIKIN